MSELIRMGMSDKEALECQNAKVSFPYVKQKLWSNKRDNKEGQNFHITQIPFDVETNDRFAMDYHIALFFDLEEMVILREEALEKITKRLEEMKILLGDEIIEPIAIMCTHGGKQWSGHAKIHLKNVQEDGVKLLQ